LKRALLSVSDKTGVVEFAKGLIAAGFELVSTGGTAKALRDAGLTCRDVSDVTKFPEMLDGRVKTLHPFVHGGLLARRDLPEHMKTIAEHGIEPIDVVCVNLYPFRETTRKPGVAAEDVIEQIDIGGPSMLRSAAKNFPAVSVVVDPADYGRVLESLKPGAKVVLQLRRELAAKVYAHTAAYDATISAWFAEQRGDRFPDRVTLAFERQQPLRYGENPEQRAAFYVEERGAGLAGLVQKGGKELSFNNLLDLEGALLAIDAFAGETACAIVKHTTPCGLATGASASEAYKKALACDPVSATAIDTLGAKKNLRVLVGTPGRSAPSDYKRVRGGLLVQDPPGAVGDDLNWQVVTRRAPTAQERADLRFAWRAVASVKSNAIVLAKGGATIGIGAGQMSRVDASFVAVHKAKTAGHDAVGCALASDAFFPFRDGIDQAAAAGVKAIVQPGGSVKDKEVIAAADEHGIAMCFTGRRTFRH
jgi:phosphoribosylaminoimidazolecarboxamide formyltransferase/IMP cyclohydrolase